MLWLNLVFDSIIASERETFVLCVPSKITRGSREAFQVSLLRARTRALSSITLTGALVLSTLQPLTNLAVGPAIACEDR